MKSIILLFLLLVGCKKFSSNDKPSHQLSNEEVFSNEHLANAMAVNMYSDPMNATHMLNGLLTRYLGLMADELQSPGTKPLESDLPWYNCQVTATDKTIASFWSRPYELIYQANNILENMQNNTKLKDSVIRRLTGEALFIRAWNYFYLVNLFDGVPSVAKTKFSENISLPRESRDSIYALIIKDLQQAENLLPVYTSGSDSALLTGTRATKWAAKALLARTYLYNKEWAKAEAYANQVIHSGVFRLEENLNNVFLINSKEVIFQLQPVKPNQNSAEATFFLPFNNQAPLLVMTKELVKSFENGDLRMTNWVGTVTAGNKTHHYPRKYKVRSSSPAGEYNVVLRLGEIYLIKAEAQAMQGKLHGQESAAASLMQLRARAGLSSLPNGLPQKQMLRRIEQERQVELFAEWGHRWLDLKRTIAFDLPGKTRAEEVLKSLKPGFKEYKLLLPIPGVELQRNPALVQNPVYE